jgi:tRNA 2-thiouridine synthesizing protein A
MSVPEPSPRSEPFDAARFARAMEFLDEAAGGACRLCDAAVCGHAALMCFAMGRQDDPLCLTCLADDSARARGALRDELAGYILRKACLSRVWRIASEREGLPTDAPPRCLWPGAQVAVADVAVPAASPAPAAPPAATESPPPTATPTPPAARWDAGELGCGDLVLELRRRLAALAAGEVLHVTARDPAAPEDLPAWCRLTGNPLAAAHHPDYFIRRRN